MHITSRIMRCQKTFKYFSFLTLLFLRNTILLELRIWTKQYRKFFFPKFWISLRPCYLAHLFISDFQSPVTLRLIVFLDTGIIFKISASSYAQSVQILAASNIEKYFGIYNFYYNFLRYFICKISMFAFEILITQCLVCKNMCLTNFWMTFQKRNTQL